MIHSSEYMLHTYIYVTTHSTLSEPEKHKAEATTMKANICVEYWLWQQQQRREEKTISHAISFVQSPFFISSSSSPFASFFLARSCRIRNEIFKTPNVARRLILILRNFYDSSGFLKVALIKPHARCCGFECDIFFCKFYFLKYHFLI